MIKKFVSVLICAFIVLSIVPFTASAAESAVYKLRVVEQTEKKITVSFDFVSGTGFSAIDFEIDYKKDKLTYSKKDWGRGLTTFVNNNDGAFKSVNSEGKSIKASIASLTPFNKQGNDGSILVVEFTKIPGAKIVEGDITVTIENCDYLDSSYNSKPVNASVSYDFGASVQTTPTENIGNNSDAKTEYEQGTSIKNGNESEIGEPVNNEQQPENSNSDVGTVQQGSVGSASVANGESESVTNDEATATNGKETSNKTKTMVIIIVAVLAVAGIGAVVLIFIKNKKKPENQI